MKACASMDQSKKTSVMIYTNYKVFPTVDKSDNNCSIMNVDAFPLCMTPIVIPPLLRKTYLNYLSHRP